MSDTPIWVPIVAAAIGAGIGACIAFAGVFFKARIDRAGRIESEARSERFDTYRRIVTLLLDGDEAGDMSKRQLAIDVALFASDEVARAWIAFLDVTLAGKATLRIPGIVITQIAPS